MKWKLDMPVAATTEEWDNWKNINKVYYPIRYFLQQTAPIFLGKWFTRLISKPINDFRWNIIYRLVRKHQYQIIRPRTLKPNYYDQDIRILHCVMECFTEFMETSIHHVDWEGTSPEYKHVYEEMQEIYAWWKYKWPSRDVLTIDADRLEKLPKLPKEWGFMPMLNEKYNNEPIIKEWIRISDLHQESKRLWINQENEMLIHIIKIREYLWD